MHLPFHIKRDGPTQNENKSPLSWGNLIFPLSGYNDVSGDISDSDHIDNDGNIKCLEYADDRIDLDDALSQSGMGSGDISGMVRQNDGQVQKRWTKFLSRWTTLEKRHPHLCNFTKQPANWGGAEGWVDDAVYIGDGSSTLGYTEAAPYGNGDSIREPEAIPSGQPFSGRMAGGSGRGQIYGSQTYGSGYSGSFGPDEERGVSERDFPFIFWPIVWGEAPSNLSASYLYDKEYGPPEDTSRPGGALKSIAFTSQESDAQTSTFHVLADNATVSSLLMSIASNCSAVLNTNSTGNQSVIPFNGTDPYRIRPEQAVFYYRASSITLTLDGYNDTVALDPQASANTSHTPLPDWVSPDLLDCLNLTIGAGAPLITNSTESILNMTSTHDVDTKTWNLTAKGVSGAQATVHPTSNAGFVGLFSLLLLLFMNFVHKLQ